MNNIKKVTIILIALLFLVSFISSNFLLSNAAGETASTITPSTVYEVATDNSDATSATQNIVGSLAVIFKAAAVGIALIVIFWLAIKYMYAAPSEKADIKKSVVIYLIGCILLFSAGTVLQIISSFATSNLGS